MIGIYGVSCLIDAQMLVEIAVVITAENVKGRGQKKSVGHQSM